MRVLATKRNGEGTLRMSLMLKRLGAGLAILALGGCNVLGSSGPGTYKVAGGKSKVVADSDIRVIDVNDTLARRLAQADHIGLFSEDLGESPPVGTVIGRGDVLDITIWEAPPAALFGMLGGQMSSAVGGQNSIQIARSSDIPQEMVDDRGMVTLPFIGPIEAAGKTLRQLESDIRNRLRGIANQPQVIVGLSHNANANVTVVGEVTTSAHVPLTPRGERLLDVIASAGGVRQAVNKVTIQITRGSTVVSVPMETVVRDPRQNIRLRADDVVTAIFQPYSFIALGATGVSSEITFEATGITLAQAIGRVGGLQDSRADVKGVFLFRLEDPSLLPPEQIQGARTTPDGKIPVIYRFNMADPGSFFIAQGFPIRNRDVLYVSNAPGSDLQKFVSITTQMAFSVIGISNAVSGSGN